MTATMKRTAILTVVLMLGSVFVVAGSASAEDIDECEQESSVEPEYGYLHSVCVKDSGDASDCPDESGNAETGASAKSFLYVVADGEFQVFSVEIDAFGRETCSPWTGHSEKIDVDADVKWWGNAGIDASPVFWNQDFLRIHFDVSCSASDEAPCDQFGRESDLFFHWGVGSSGECTTTLYTQGPDGRETLVSEGCPAGGPPGAPNPGWGSVTPDT